MNLSENFTTDELCTSFEHPELAKKIKPTPEDIQQATLLAQSVLQPIRDQFGPIIILSWKRSPE